MLRPDLQQLILYPSFTFHLSPLGIWCSFYESMFLLLSDCATVRVCRGQRLCRPIVLNKVFNQLSVGVFLSQHVISVLCESGMDCVSCLTNILKG